MRILYDNYLNSSALLASSQNSSYPVTNVIHKFLEKPWKSLLYTASITITFPENKEIDTIALGFITANSVTYEALNAVDAVLQSGNLEFSYPTNMTYIPAVTARKIKLYFQGTGSVTVGGISIGKSVEYPIVQANPRFQVSPRGNGEKTPGGQALGRKYRALRGWSIVIPDISNAERKVLESITYQAGSITPIYIDLYEESHEEEYPMYATLTNIGNSRRDSENQTYTMGLAVEEAR